MTDAFYFSYLFIDCWYCTDKKNNEGSTMSDHEISPSSQQQQLQEAPRRPFLLEIAADVEGHAGNDGLFYLIDLARLFPPRQPRSDKTENWWRLWRPEFLKRYCFERRLSCDAFSPFGEENREEHEQDIEVAEEWMEKKAWMQLVSDLQEEKDLQHSSLIDGENMMKKISEIFHKHGVNLSDMGEIQKRARSPKVKERLLMMMVARSVKCVCREWMQNLIEKQVKERKLLGIESSQVIVILLGLVFGVEKTNYDFWQKALILYVQVYIYFIPICFSTNVLFIRSLALSLADASNEITDNNRCTALSPFCLDISLSSLPQISYIFSNPISGMRKLQCLSFLLSCIFN